MAARRLRSVCLQQHIGICWLWAFRLQSPEKRRVAMSMISMLRWIGRVRQIDDTHGSLFQIVLTWLTLPAMPALHLALPLPTR